MCDLLLVEFVVCATLRGAVPPVPAFDVPLPMPLASIWKPQTLLLARRNLSHSRRRTYQRDKKSGIRGTPGTWGGGTRIPCPFHEHARAVRSPLVCRNEPDSIGRREVYPSRVTGERDGS